MKWGSRLYHFCKKWCLPCLGMPSAGLSEGSPTGKGHPCTPSFSCLGLTLGKALPTLPGTVDCFLGATGHGCRPVSLWLTSPTPTPHPFRHHIEKRGVTFSHAPLFDARHAFLGLAYLPNIRSKKYRTCKGKASSCSCASSSPCVNSSSVYSSLRMPPRIPPVRTN